MELKTPWREVILLWLAEIVFQGTTKYVSLPEGIFISKLLGSRSSPDDPATSGRLWRMPKPPGFEDYCRVVLRDFERFVDDGGSSFAINNGVAFALLHLSADAELYENCLPPRISED